MLVAWLPGSQGLELSPARYTASVATMAPNTSISKIAGKATRAISSPTAGDAVMNCDTISSAIDDMGDMAAPTHSACFQLAPLPTLPSATPATLAMARAAIRATTRPVTGALQSACAATVETSTNIIMVSSEAAVPICRGHDQGRGLICLSSMPPSSAASGAEPPRWAAMVAAAEISASSRIEVFSLDGLMKRSAVRKARASKPPTAIDTPSTTATG